MSDSILTSIKKLLDIQPEYTHYDANIMMYINSVIASLSQLGVGPTYGFMIQDATSTWDDFLGDDPRLNNVKTLIWLQVKLLFDPPPTSFAIDSFKEQIAKLEWLISVHRENELSPSVIPDDTELIILDGGAP